MSAPNDLIAGRYRLVHRVGRGGMGVVWEAWDERLHRKVAVKQLHAQLGLSDADTELANLRAMREARITARLDHPHAVPVFDVVEHEGQPCLIMQFLPSTPLSEVLREHETLPLTETARIGAQIASALAAAHRAGIVHRDVKPGNVLIAEDGTARISDFGISHALGDTTLTATGMVHGTPAYLAPEVARGGDSTFASDVFGLGATLYTAREGAPPFGKDQNSIALLHKVASGVFAPPTHSGTLTPLLLRMLAADPAERPDMGEVARKLTALAAQSGAEPDTLRFAEADISTVASDVPRPQRPWTRGVAASSVAATGTDPAPAAGASPYVAAGAPATVTAAEPPSATTAAVPLGTVAAEPLDTAATQTRQSLDSAPAQPPSRPGAPPPPAASAPPPEPAPPRRRGLLWAALAVVALLGLALGGYALLPGRDNGLVTTTTTGTGTSAAPTRATQTRRSPSASASSPGPTSSAASSSVPSSSSPSASASSTSASSASASSSTSTTSGQSSSPSASTSPSQAATSPTDSTVSGRPTAKQLAGAVSSYYDLVPGNTDGGWQRLTSSYQRNKAKGRASYERFWASIDRVSVSNVQGNPPDGAVATVRYVFKSGRVVTEVTSFTLVNDGGTLKINRSSVISSQ